MTAANQPAAPVAVHVITALLLCSFHVGAVNVSRTWVPADLAWRSFAGPKTYWGYPLRVNRSDAAKHCEDRGAVLWRVLDTKDHLQAALMLRSSYWVGLAVATANSTPYWDDGQVYQSSDEFGTASPTMVQAPWCAAVSFPVETKDPTDSQANEWMQAMDCDALNSFLCSFSAGADLARWQRVGIIHSTGSAQYVAAVRVLRTWQGARAYCAQRGGQLASLSDNNVDLLLRRDLRPMPPFNATTAAIPPPATTAAGEDGEQNPRMWLGLEACSPYSENQGYECSWSGGLNYTLGPYYLPSGQDSKLIYQALESGLCTSVSAMDLNWDLQTSCLDTASVVCEAEAPADTHGYVGYKVHWRTALYTFFATPAALADAAAVCAAVNSTLPSNVTAEEQAWIALASSALMRGQPVLVNQLAAINRSAARAAAPAGGRCLVMGAASDASQALFMAGVQRLANCSKPHAFVCRQGVAQLQPLPPPPPVAVPQAAALPPFGKQLRTWRKKALAFPTPAIFAICLAVGVLIAAVSSAAIRVISHRHPIGAKSISSNVSNPPAISDCLSDRPPSAPGAPASPHTPLSTMELSTTELDEAATGAAAASSRRRSRSLTTSFSSQNMEFANPLHAAHPSTGGTDSPPAPRASHSYPLSADNEVLHVVLDMDPEQDIKIFRDRKLGQGGFSSVYLGEYQGVLVAVKTLDVLSMAMAGSAAAQSQELAAIERELRILSDIQHPNIVRLYGGCLTPPNVMIVMELMECSLAEYAARTGPRLPLRTALQIIRAVAAGITHLHPRIIHQDLKPQNILLDNQGNVKISDFGVSRIKKTTYFKTEQFTAGTIPYMAPECYQSTNVTEKCDIYSLGMILWECIAGAHPWEGLNGMAVMYHVGCLRTRPELSPAVLGCPPAVAALIARCWAQEPQQRPSAAEVIEEINSIEARLDSEGSSSAAAAAAAAAGAPTRA